MNFLLNFYSIILPTIVSYKPKLCINCKYFISDKQTDEFGKCSLFPKKEANIYYLVNGIEKKEYYYCSVVRSMDDMCGYKGKNYKKKIVKNIE